MILEPLVEFTQRGRRLYWAELRTRIRVLLQEALGHRSDGICLFKKKQQGVSTFECTQQVINENKIYMARHKYMNKNVRPSLPVGLNLNTYLSKAVRGVENKTFSKQHSITT
jgi:hypothetical protein